MRPVSSERMAAADAQLLWLSEKVPNDQFLVFQFDGSADIASAIDEVRRRAQACAALRVRVRDDHPWRYPRWVTGDVGDAQFVVHEPARDWRAPLASVIASEHLDATRMAWRVHVFPSAVVPPAVVVVVQMSHALGDGTRSASLAAALLGRRTPVPMVSPDRGNLILRGIVAARAHRGMVRQMAAGELEPPPAPRPVLSVNARPTGVPVLRTLAVDRPVLRGSTVTVAVLSAVAQALGGYLADRGEDVGHLGAEIPMAGPPSVAAGNNFRNVGIGLHPQLRPEERATRIAGELAAARRRAQHRASQTSAAAFAVVPARLLRWGVSQFDPGARSSTVSGHTVVSSVNRGPADLTFGGCRVVLTAGFPALSPMMSLTHGVHGIGDVVAVSVNADPTVVDVEEYVDRLAHALGVSPSP